MAVYPNATTGSSAPSAMVKETRRAEMKVGLSVMKPNARGDDRTPHSCGARMNVSW